MRTNLFDPMTVQIVGDAFDDACRKLPAVASDEIKNLLARRILGSASLGVRDPIEMRDDGLDYIST